jgi:hypothetical protein
VHHADVPLVPPSTDAIISKVCVVTLKIGPVIALYVMDPDTETISPSCLPWLGKATVMIAELLGLVHDSSVTVVLQEVTDDQSRSVAGVVLVDHARPSLEVIARLPVPVLVTATYSPLSQHALCHPRVWLVFRADTVLNEMELSVTVLALVTIFPVKEHFVGETPSRVTAPSILVVVRVPPVTTAEFKIWHKDVVTSVSVV